METAHKETYKETRKSITKEIVKVAFLSWLLYYAFNNANYPDSFWNPTTNIFRGAIIVLVYFVGRSWGKVVSKNEYSNWKAYPHSSGLRGDAPILSP
jgi:hypothetical protein